MTRYTINIGDDFPLGGDEEPGRSSGSAPEQRHRRHRRYGLFLRVLFFLAVAAIVIGHPLQTLLVVGAVLLVRRSGAFQVWRDRARSTWADPQWRQARRDAWQRAWQRQGGCCWNRGARHGSFREHGRDGNGYRGFV